MNKKASMTLFQGDSKIINFSIIKSTTDKTYLPIDITGAEIFLGIKGSDGVSLSFVQTNHTDPTNGKTRLTITHEFSKNLPIGLAEYDLRMKIIKNGVIEATTLKYGYIEVLESITKI